MFVFYRLRSSAALSNLMKRRLFSMAGQFRKEKDSFGLIDVPIDALWGAQTQRSLKYFDIGGPAERMPNELIHALAVIKKAAAICNCERGYLSKDIKEAIVQVCDEVPPHLLNTFIIIKIMHDKLTEHFPLKIWQTGSGTQTNMNINEVWLVIR